MSCHHSTGQNHYIKVANKFFKNVAKFIYLGIMVMNQNYIYEDIKSRLNSGNVCYSAVQNLLSSSLLCKNIKIKIYKL
jgi:hypothetical protein